MPTTCNKNRLITDRFIFQLIGGLSDEKGRWQESVKTLQAVVDNIVGDILVSAGSIAYLGIFPVSVSQLKVDPVSSDVLRRGNTVLMSQLLG